MAALEEAGKRIPEDVRVIGFDDVFICESMEPSLSSVHIDKVLLGQKSISLLLDRIQGKKCTASPTKRLWKTVWWCVILQMRLQLPQAAGSTDEPHLLLDKGSIISGPILTGR